MHYTMLLYESREAFAARSDPRKQEAFMGSFLPYINALTDAGIVVASGGLQVPETATTIRRAGDQRQVQDGPYADTKEQLGGFFVIDVPDLDAALDWANRCPVGVAIEVRPNLPPVRPPSART
jgi:hypothetical protein